MNVTLNSAMERFIAKEVKSCRYKRADDVVRAAMQTLMQQSVPEFAAGDLDALLAEGEESIAREGTLDGEAAYQERRRRRAARGLTPPSRKASR